MKTEVVLDFKRITAEVAARHGMLVSQDDPAMLLVTMNEVVLQQVFGKHRGSYRGNRRQPGGGFPFSPTRSVGKR